ncbi:hypothetical protein Tco_0457908 [Tanacetum coccineum]|uniref:Uncharacterized protein n=1 Tax=Tanacetum coccineum TaxID=301880 RepID=A0ABQ4YZU0_9ASTR
MSVACPTRSMAECDGKLSNKTIQDAIEFATELIDKKIILRMNVMADNKRKFLNDTAETIQWALDLCVPNVTITMMVLRVCFELRAQGLFQKRIVQIEEQQQPGYRVVMKCQGSRQRCMPWQSLDLLSTPTALDHDYQCRTSDGRMLGISPPTKTKTKHRGNKLKVVPVVQEFPEVFPRIAGLYHQLDKWKFRNRFSTGATPVARWHISLAPVRNEGLVEKSGTYGQRLNRPSSLTYVGSVSVCKEVERWVFPNVHDYRELNKSDQ